MINVLPYADLIPYSMFDFSYSSSMAIAMATGLVMMRHTTGI